MWTLDRAAIDAMQRLSRMNWAALRHAAGTIWHQTTFATAICQSPLNANADLAGIALLVETAATNFIPPPSSPAPIIGLSRMDVVSR